jgi:positive regulator of sigma E activity
MMSAIVAFLLAMLIPLALFAMNKVQIVALVLAIVVAVIFVRRRAKRSAKS